ncbi:hypothetical protein RKD35_004661 [Streptomyces albogriseolus]
MAGGLQDRLAFPLGALPGESAQRRARGAAQRDGLEHRQAVRHGVGAEDAQRGGHRAFGAHPQPQRHQQLGDVHAQQQVAGRDLPAAQVGEDHRAGTIHQDGVAHQPAVRDAAGLQRLHLVPGVAQQVVGDLLVGQRVQRVSAGVLVDEHHRVGAELRRGDQLGRVGAGRDGGVGQQGLLLQRLAQRLQAPAGGEAAQRQIAPRPVEEALSLLLAVDHGDVEGRAVLQGDEVAAPPVSALGGVGSLLAGGGHGAEADRPEPRHQGAAGGPDVGRADRVERAVGDGPADQHGEDDRERGGVPGDQHREGVEQQHHPQHRAPPWSAGHADGGHVRDDGCEIAVHRVGEGVDVAGGGLGERVLDRVGGGPRDPQVGGEGHPVRQHGGEHTVGDPQPVPFDQTFDREGDRDQQDGDAGRQARDLDEQVGRLPGALVDVLFESRGGAVGERGDRQEHHDREHAAHQPHEVGRAVHARGEQRFVALDLVDVRDVPVRAVRLFGGVRARRGVRGALRVLGVRTLLLHRLFSISYHRSPPARWWHAVPPQGGIRVHKRGGTVCPKRCSGASRPPVSAEAPRCRWGGAGWSG